MVMGTCDIWLGYYEGLFLTKCGDGVNNSAAGPPGTEVLKEEASQI